VGIVGRGTQNAKSYAFFFDVLDRMNTEPLCPRVIRMVSSIYPVRSQPVGPKIPRGKVTSTGDLWTKSRQESNLTSTRRLSSAFGWNLTSTVRDARRSKAGRLTLTTLRTRFFCRSIDWLLLAPWLSWMTPRSSKRSCTFRGNTGLNRPISLLFGLLLYDWFSRGLYYWTLHW
jgi:hypothetical protein